MVCHVSETSQQEAEGWGDVLAIGFLGTDRMSGATRLEDHPRNLASAPCADSRKPRGLQLRVPKAVLVARRRR
jgi:hypothetical protein